MLSNDNYYDWGKVRNRLIPKLCLKCFPTFKIDKEDKIFTIGNLFCSKH